MVKPVMYTACLYVYNIAAHVSYITDSFILSINSHHLKNHNVTFLYITVKSKFSVIEIKTGLFVNEFSSQL